MTWFHSILIAVLTAAFTAVGTGLIAGLAVDWYRISSREGGSGYFVIMIGFLGLIGGFLWGLVTARVVASGVHPFFLKGLGYSLLGVTVLMSFGGGISRLLADVPPTLHGEKLHLLVELRWPATQATSPAGDGVIRNLQLGALSGSTLRTSKSGPLWMEDARLEDGRWIVPGAVEVFTSRGARIIAFEPPIPGALGFQIPLPRYPREKALNWSDWLPRAGPSSATLPGAWSYRFKVVPRSMAVRTERIGPFEIDTIAEFFYPQEILQSQFVAGGNAGFEIRYRGRSIAESDTPPIAEAPQGRGGDSSPKPTLFGSVATLPGSPTALLVSAGSFLVTDAGDHAEVTRVSSSTYYSLAIPVTNDQAWRESAKTLPRVMGRIDRRSFMHPGVYWFQDALFDAGNRSVKPFGPISQAVAVHGSVLPLGLSPDGQSFARLGFSETERDAPALLVFGVGSSATYSVSVDRKATRYPGDYGIDCDWLNHYYTWIRGANERDQLVLRRGISPLPYRGALSVQSEIDLVYTLQPVVPAMRGVIWKFLCSEFQLQPLPGQPAGDGREGHIGALEVHVFYNESVRSVSVFLAHGSEMSLMPQIAARFNSVLATGIHDVYFDPGTAVQP